MCVCVCVWVGVCVCVFVYIIFLFFLFLLFFLTKTLYFEELYIVLLKQSVVEPRETSADDKTTYGAVQLNGTILRLRERFSAPTYSVQTVGLSLSNQQRSMPRLEEKKAIQTRLYHLVDWFNAELTLEKYWRGPRLQEVGGGGDFTYRYSVNHQNDSALR